MDTIKGIQRLDVVKVVLSPDVADGIETIAKHLAADRTVVVLTPELRDRIVAELLAGQRYG